MKKIFSAAFITLFLTYAGIAFAAEESEAVKQLTQNQILILDKEREIAELNKKIETLRKQRDTTAAEAGVINSQLKKLENQVSKAQLEMKQIQLTITSVNHEQKQTEKSISDLEKSLNEKRQQLRELIRALHEYEQKSLLGMFLSSFSLGDVINQRTAYAQLQEDTLGLMTDLRTQEKELNEHNEVLSDQQKQLQILQGALTEQQAELEQQQSEKELFLRKKKQEQVAYERDLAVAQKTRAEIEKNVFNLKDAGVSIKLTDAKDMARYASKLTGVRAALLMGLLKVESDIGNNVGNGKYPDDMQPASREAFLRVTKKLGLDPNTAPISARPRSYQGWGGAMGPGQFMPATWERIEERLTALVHHTPNPYDLADAFTASGMFLADKGAANRDMEYEAVNRYLAGPNWQRFTWYGDRVLAIAKEYEKDGL